MTVESGAKREHDRFDERPSRSARAVSSAQTGLRLLANLAAESSANAAALQQNRVSGGRARRNQLPIGPPSFFVRMSNAERGRPPAGPSGQELNCLGLAGSLLPDGASPGCCMPTNMVVSHGGVPGVSGRDRLTLGRPRCGSMKVR